MSPFRDRDTGDIVGIIITFTLCFCFTMWVVLGLIRWVVTPDAPEPPSNIDISIEACKKNGGVPYTKWISIDGYQKELLDRCTKDPAVQQ